MGSKEMEECSLDLGRYSNTYRTKSGIMAFSGKSEENKANIGIDNFRASI
jgi:hypothetical protein